MHKRTVVWALLILGMALCFCVGKGLCQKKESAKESKPYVLLDEESEISEWKGAESNEDFVKKGKYSAKWVGVERGTAMMMESPPNNWSQYNLISFWLYSENANNAKIVFNCVSENEETEGGDYFHMQITINWKGWKEFKIPFSSFGPARTPVGWNRINRVEFYSKGWGIEPKEDTVLYFDDMKLEKSVAIAAEEQKGKARMELAKKERTEPVCYLKFDEGKGDVLKDASGAENDGEINGEPEWVKGKFGYALKFDGVDDYVELPFVLPATAQKMTIECWVNPATLTRPEWETVILNKRVSKTSWSLYQTQDAKIGFTVWAGDPGPAYAVSTSKISENTWHHIVVTYDGANTIKIYLNGELCASKTDVQKVQDNEDPTTNKIMIAKGGNPKRFFSGMIDEVKIYNRVLTDAEIKASYNKK